MRYGATPLLDKEVRFADSDGVHRTPEIGGDRGWLTCPICLIPHHPPTPSSAEEGSYFQGREVVFKPEGECRQMRNVADLTPQRSPLRLLGLARFLFIIRNS